MTNIKHLKCDHPKCSAKMQRHYKRDNSNFVPCGWLYVDWGLFKKTISHTEAYADIWMT